MKTVTPSSLLRKRLPFDSVDFLGNTAWSINQNGDIVGVSNDANGNWLATHRLTTDHGNWSE